MSDENFEKIKHINTSRSGKLQKGVINMSENKDEHLLPVINILLDKISRGYEFSERTVSKLRLLATTIRERYGGEKQ